MNHLPKFLLLFGALVLSPDFLARAETPPVRHRDTSVWVEGELGSHLGSGYTSAYLTNIRARTTKRDDPKLRDAIDSLDGLGMVQVKGFGLVPAAVAWQSNKPMRKIIQQQADTGLSYGELLMANVLAAKSRQSFTEVVAMRTRTRTWGELAAQLRVDPDVIVTRAKIASERILAAESQSRRHSPRDGGTSLSGTTRDTQHEHHH